MSKKPLEQWQYAAKWDEPRECRICGGKAYHTISFGFAEDYSPENGWPEKPLDHCLTVSGSSILGDEVHAPVCSACISRFGYDPIPEILETFVDWLTDSRTDELERNTKALLCWGDWMQEKEPASIGTALKALGIGIDEVVAYLKDFFEK